jgi:hypothetical protein
MGMQQTYGGVARIIAPLFFGWSFDRLGSSSPYLIASVFILGTIFLGFGLDKYAKHEEAPVLQEAVAEEAQPLPQTEAQEAPALQKAGSTG